MTFLTQVQLLRRLVLPLGSVLRPVGVARPTRDCLFADVAADGVSPLKLWNFNAGGAGTPASCEDTTAKPSSRMTRRTFRPAPAWDEPLTRVSPFGGNS